MKRWLIVGVPLAVLAALIGWRVSIRSAEAAAQVRQRAARRQAPVVVDVAPARVRDVVQRFETIGTVQAPLDVKLSPEVTGRIVYLTAREGDRVRPGEVLARIDPSEVEAQVRQQAASVAEAEARLAQAALNQNPTGVSVRSQIRQQQAALASAKAEVRKATQSDAAERAAAGANVADMSGRVASALAAVTSAEASVASAQASLENARARQRRVEDLYKQGFIAAQDVDDARTAARVQEGALSVARGQLNVAKAQRDSAQAQKRASEHQAEVVKASGAASITAAGARQEQAQATLDAARANLAQVPAYRANLQALRAAVREARAALHNAEARRAQTTLTAPMEGIVSDRGMDPGSLASPGQPILTIQQIREVWVTVPAPGTVVQRLRPGQPATVTIDALPGRSFAGRIGRINPSADPSSRQFAVRVVLPNPGTLIRPGMFGRVSLVTERVSDATVVPREAVEQGPEGASVVVVDADLVARRRTVTLGASDPAGYAVLSGVSPGDRVVVMSVAPVKDGATVRLGGERGGARGGGVRGSGGASS